MVGEPRHVWSSKRLNNLNKKKKYILDKPRGPMAPMGLVLG